MRRYFWTRRHKSVNLPDMADELTWLQEWYAANCDGDWEHTYGITIESLDNPGWKIEIDLTDTSLADRPFVSQSNLAGSSSWWDCKVEGGKFRGFCGPRDIGLVVGVFRTWAAS
jgi:hypothetical protein